MTSSHKKDVVKIIDLYLQVRELLLKRRSVVSDDEALALTKAIWLKGGA